MQLGTFRRRVWCHGEQFCCQRATPSASFRPRAKRVRQQQRMGAVAAGRLGSFWEGTKYTVSSLPRYLVPAPRDKEGA